MLLFRSSAQNNVIFYSTSDLLVIEHEFFSALIQLYRSSNTRIIRLIRIRSVKIRFIKIRFWDWIFLWEKELSWDWERLRESFFLEDSEHIDLDRVITRYFTSLFLQIIIYCIIVISVFSHSHHSQLFFLLFMTWSFEEILQSDRDRDLKKEILVEERWNDVNERQRQKCIENVKNNCCCRMIIRKRYISRQLLMRCVELDLENWNKSREKDINKVVSDFEFRDDVQFRRALIRNVEIREAEDINKRIDAIWLRWNVFIYKQRAFQIEVCRLEIQRNQKFDRCFVNFRSFDFDCLDSNNLSTLRRFNDSFIQNALNVNDCEIFAEEKHCD